MAIGFSIFKAKRFPEGKEFTTQDQLFLVVDGMSETEPVETRVKLTHEDYQGVQRFSVEHDYRARLKTPARALGHKFMEYVQTQSFNLYLEPSERGDSRCMILATKADIAKDATARLTKKRQDFIALERHLDFSILRPQVATINGAWFGDMKAAHLSSSGYFGAHVDKSDEFKRAETNGTLKNIMIHYPFHEVTLTVGLGIHGGVVLYDAFDEPTAISLVLDVKRTLLDSAWSL